LDLLLFILIKLSLENSEKQNTLCFVYKERNNLKKELRK
jgi:hypothetical protein